MISFSPIWAITLRNMYLWRRDINSILFLLYWPVLDILTWGFLGTWIQQSSTGNFKNYETVALLGILLWQIIGRGANSIAFSFCEELWSQNLVNIFSFPLHLAEWILGTLLYYVFSLTIITAFSMCIIYALYDVSLVNILWTFLKFMPPLFLCCIWLGFTCLQIMVTLGRRGIELGFVIIWFLLPFSGAYYPVDILPAWGKTLSSLIPMSYVFTAMRSSMMHHQDPTHNLMIGYALSTLYAAIAVGLFVYCFNRSKNQGLTRLMN